MFLNRLVSFFNRVSPVIIQTPWIGAIGNCSEEMYYGLLKARRDNKRVLMLFPKDLFWIFIFSKRGLGINSELNKVNSPYRCGTHNGFLTVAGQILLMGLFCAFKFIDGLKQKYFNRNLDHRYRTPTLGKSALWCPEGAVSFSPEKVKGQHWREQLSTLLPVTIPAASRRKAEVLREEMGLPLETWYVCLHVREGGFYGYNEGPMKTSRNTAIENYLKAIQFITDSDGWVVRMGDSSMSHLPSLPRVIDYPHTRFKSDLMDIYLIQACRFYIGSQSGIWSTASLFQRPMITPNMNEWIDSFPEREGDLGIIKHVYSRKKKRFLSLKETLDEFSRFQYSYNYLDDYELYENTPDEIFELVKEYMEQDGDYRLSELQGEWNRRRIAEGYLLLEKDIFLKDPQGGLQLKYHLASRLEGCCGSLGQRFLEKNWKYNCMNRDMGKQTRCAKN